MATQTFNLNTLDGYVGNGPADVAYFGLGSAYTGGVPSAITVRFRGYCNTPSGDNNLIVRLVGGGTYAYTDVLADYGHFDFINDGAGTAFDLLSGPGHDYSLTFTPADYVASAPVVMSFLSAGDWAVQFDPEGAKNIWIATPVTGDNAIFADVTWATRAPMRRKYPNPTGQGVGPARHWPRPRRGVGGIN